MLGVVDVTDDAVAGTKTGVVLQLDSNTLLVGTRNPFYIYKSENLGNTWSLKHTESHPQLKARLSHIAASGSIFFGSFISGAPGKLLRSSDDGETWTEVLESESSAFWWMAETSNGDLYAQEYSGGLVGEDYRIAANVWKSTNDGVNWSKFYSFTGTSEEMDAFFHLHGIFADSNDQLYVSIGHGDMNGDYFLNSNGTLGSRITGSDKGQGSICFCETDSGDVLFGSDTPQGEISLLDQGDFIYEHTISRDMLYIKDETSEIFGLVRGKDSGVLYALSTGSSTQKRSYVLASYDNGTKWGALKYTDTPGEAVNLTINQNVENSRLYITRSPTEATYMSIPDYTSDQLKTMFATSVSFNGTITPL